MSRVASKTALWLLLLVAQSTVLASAMPSRNSSPAAKKASSYRRHTANADFGASAGDPDVTIKFWREAWFSRNKAWLPREWKLKNDRRGGYLCWFCSGRRDEASGRCEADSPFCSQARVFDPF